MYKVPTLRELVTILFIERWSGEVTFLFLSLLVSLSIYRFGFLLTCLISLNWVLSNLVRRKF